MPSHEHNIRFFSIQWRRSAVSAWLKPKGGLQKVDNPQWCDIGDNMMFTAEPWIGSGNDCRPAYKHSHSQVSAVKQATAFQERGWFSADYVLYAIARLREADAQGKFDSRDSYGKLHQAVRHEFRVVEIKTIRQVSPVNEDMLRSKIDPVCREKV